jgi:hypothetical protein
MNSKQGIRRNTRFESDFNNEVETYQKLHKIKTWNKALHLRDKENLQRIEELTSELASLKNKEQSIFDFMQRKGLSEDTPLDKDMSISAPAQISEKACKGLSHKKNGEPFCIDPTSPISSDARRHLNHEVCKFCKEERAKQPKEDEKKQEEEIKRFYEQKKREVHDLQKSVNETIKKQNSSKGFFTNADGTRIPY